MELEHFELEEKTEFNSLLMSIKRRSCALLLGPLFGKLKGDKGIDFDNCEKGLNDHVKTTLKSKWGERLDYKHDGLYLLRPTKSHQDITDQHSLQGDIAEAYSNQVPADLCNKLAHIPFRLIVNCSCDNFLVNAFRANGRPFNFFYYSAQKKMIIRDSDDEFNDKAPTIFNLFGTIDDYDSLIVDHDKFFTFLSVIFSEQNSLPKEVYPLLNINNTVRFLMLGFNMDNWYIPQMIYRLNAFSNQPTTFKQREGLTDWLQDPQWDKHLDPFPLNMRAFREASSQILESVYQNFQVNGSVQQSGNQMAQKRPMSKGIQLIDNLFDKIANAVKLDEIFQEIILNQSVLKYDPQQYNSYITQKRKHKENEHNMEASLISMEAYGVEKNKIIDWLTDNLQKLKVTLSYDA